MQKCISMTVPLRENLNSKLEIAQKRKCLLQKFFQ